MIGKTVWVFNENHRVYEKKTPEETKRNGSGGPIYREHWQPEVITAETTKSWITHRGTKFPKKDPHREYRGIAHSPEELDNKVFMHDHRHFISTCVGGVSDIHILREIARLIGYDEKEKRCPK